MQFSNETIQFLKNFAAINSNILIRKGQTLSTISTAKNIFARVTVTEDFPAGTFVYDLEIRSVGGIVDRIIEGSFIVTPEVTR